MVLTDVHVRQGTCDRLVFTRFPLKAVDSLTGGENLKPQLSDRGITGGRDVEILRVTFAGRNTQIDR